MMLVASLLLSGFAAEALDQFGHGSPRRRDDHAKRLLGGFARPVTSECVEGLRKIFYCLAMIILLHQPSEVRIGKRLRMAKSF